MGIGMASKVLAVNSAHVLDVEIGLPKMLPDILVTITDSVRRDMLPPFVIFDSGGFLFALEGRYEEAEQYLSRLISMYKNSASRRDLLLQLDLPLLPTMDKDTRFKLQMKNVKFYRIMKRIFGWRLVPVIHGWEEDEWGIQVSRLRRNERVVSFFGFLSPSIKKNGSGIRLSPVVVVTRLVKITRYLLRRTNARLMLLGGGSPKALYLASLLGYELADSSTWRVASFFGEVIHPRTLNRIKATRIDRYLADFKEAFDLIKTVYDTYWSFEEWRRLIRERSRRGYIARAWFNAMIAKIVQHRIQDMPEQRLIRETLTLYRKSRKWYTIAKHVVKNAQYMGFEKAIPKE